MDYTSRQARLLEQTKTRARTTGLYVGAALAMAALVGALASGVQFVEMATGG